MLDKGQHISIRNGTRNIISVELAACFALTSCSSSKWQWSEASEVSVHLQALLGAVWWLQSGQGMSSDSQQEGSLPRLPYVSAFTDVN